MYQRKATKKIKIFGIINLILIFYIFTLTIGYSFFSETLKISGTASTIDDVRDWFTWDSNTVVSGLTDKGIAAVKASGGELVIPEGVTAIADPNFNFETGEGAIDKGFSPIAIGKLDINDDASMGKIEDPEINFITSVTFPSSLKKIGFAAFAYATKLTGHVDLLNVEEIGNSSFTMTNITSLKFGNSLKKVDDLAFFDCPEISGDLYFPDSLESIGTQAFGLGDVTLNKVTNISLSAKTRFVTNSTYEGSFINRIQPTIRSFGKYDLTASGQVGSGSYYSYVYGYLYFTGDGNVTSTTMFDEILEQIVTKNNIDVSVFQELNSDTVDICTAFVNVYLKGAKYGENISLLGLSPTREDLKTFFVTGIILDTQLITYPMTEEQADKVLAIIDVFQQGLTLDLNGVRNIGTEAFSLIKTDSITIPDSVTTIGKQAFDSVITNAFTFGKGIRTIPSSLFAKGYSGSGMDILLSLSYIKNINISSVVTTISDQAFRGIYDLETITIPSSVTSIGKMAFNKCENLKTVVNKTGKGFDWNNIITGNSGTIFETGSLGAITITK